MSLSLGQQMVFDIRGHVALYIQYVDNAAYCVALLTMWFYHVPFCCAKQCYGTNIHTLMTEEVLLNLTGS
jgi:hypothetical protein